MDAPRRVLIGDLLVVDGRIAALGDDVPAALRALPGGRAPESFDAHGALVLPGFVHAHLHLCQTLFRGFAEQSDLLELAARRDLAARSRAHGRSLAASVRLGACELIAGGVTCVNDMGTVHHTECCGAALEPPARAVFAAGAHGPGRARAARLLEGAPRALEAALALADRWHGAAGGRLRVSLAPRFILSCSERLWRDVTDASRERGLLVHTHLAEAPTEGGEVKAAVGSHAAPYFAKARRAVAAVRGRTRRVARRGRGRTLQAGRRGTRPLPGLEPEVGSGLADVRRLAPRGRALRPGLGRRGVQQPARHVRRDVARCRASRASCTATTRCRRATWWHSPRATARPRWDFRPRRVRSRPASKPT
jgi:hypothetical protein